jgi:hypothetical protein
MAQVTEGLKYDSSKLPEHLYSPIAHKRLLEVMQYGANKYTIKFNTEWHSIFHAKNVVSLTLQLGEYFVARVMKSISGQLILNLQNDKEPIVETGIETTDRESFNISRIDSLIQNLRPEMPKLNGKTVSQNTDSLARCTNSYALQDVRYAEAPNFLTLTTVIKQGNSEVSFVVNATTVLGSLEMTLGELQKLSIISKQQTLKELTGQRNWEAGMGWSRLYAAAERHLHAWWAGESNDSETGLSHLAHALACLHFLNHYEHLKVGKDDRPKYD